MCRTLPVDPYRLGGCPLTFDEILDCGHQDAHHGPDPDDLELALGDELIGQGPANSQETGGIGNAQQERRQIEVRFHVGAKRAGIMNLMDRRDSW